MRPALGGYHRKLCSQPAPVSDAPALLLGGAEAGSFRRGDQAQPDIRKAAQRAAFEKDVCQSVARSRCHRASAPAWHSVATLGDLVGARPEPSGTATLLRTSRITHSGERWHDMPFRHSIAGIQCRSCPSKHTMHDM